MNGKTATIYISDNSPSCEKLINQMEKWGISYRIKNITKNNDIKKDLQNQGIYGTPATFIKGNSEPILGVQLSKLKRELNVHDS